MGRRGLEPFRSHWYMYPLHHSSQPFVQGGMWGVLATNVPTLPCVAGGCV